MFATPEVVCVVAADPERCLGVRVKHKVPREQIRPDGDRELREILVGVVIRVWRVQEQGEKLIREISGCTNVSMVSGRSKGMFTFLVHHNRKIDILLRGGQSLVEKAKRRLLDLPRLGCNRLINVPEIRELDVRDLAHGSSKERIHELVGQARTGLARDAEERNQCR